MQVLEDLSEVFIHNPYVVKHLPTNIVTNSLIL